MMPRIQVAFELRIEKLWADLGTLLVNTPPRAMSSSDKKIANGRGVCSSGRQVGNYRVRDKCTDCGR